MLMIPTYELQLKSFWKNLSKAISHVQCKGHLNIIAWTNFFLNEIFAKFQLENNDFDLYKRFFMKELAQIFKEKNLNYYIFMISSNRESKI